MKTEGNGIISSTVVGSFGGGNPFDGDPEVVEAKAPGLAPVTPITMEQETSAVDQLKYAEEPKAGADTEESPGEVLRNMIVKKSLAGDDFKIEPGASISDTLSKFKDHILADKDNLVEERVKERIGDEDTAKTAKMLNSGISPASQNNFALLSSYVNVDVESDDETQVANTKHIIEEHLRSLLKGKALERALGSVDEFGDDFVALGKEAKVFFVEQREALRESIIQKEEKKVSERVDFVNKSKALIEAGEVMGHKLEKSEVKRFVKDIFTDKTETIVAKDDDGNEMILKGTKYEKAWFELEKDPQKMALLMMLVVDDFKFLIERGKDISADNFERKLAGKLTDDDTNPRGKVFPIKELAGQSWKSEVVGRGTF